MDDTKKKCSDDAPRRALKPVPQITLSEAPDIDQTSDDCIVVPPPPPSDSTGDQTYTEGDAATHEDSKNKKNEPAVTDKPKTATDTPAKVTDKEEKPKEQKDSTAKPVEPAKVTDKPDTTAKAPDKKDAPAKAADKTDNNVKAKADTTTKAPDKADNTPKTTKTDAKPTDKPDNTPKPDTKPTEKKTDTPKTDATKKTEATKPPENSTNAVKSTEDKGKGDKVSDNSTKPPAKVSTAEGDGKGAPDGKAKDGGHEEEESVPFSREEETIPLRSKEVEEKEEKEKKHFVPARVIFAVLGCVGFMIVYGLKVNLSVAIIAMVNHTAVAHMSTHHEEDNGHHDDTNTTMVHDYENITLDDCGVKKTEESLEDGPFAWDENVQGLILASYFYGYLFTQVPGGWVAEKFSAKHVFGVGALVNAICAILSPIAAQGSYIWLVVIRIIMGVAGGVTLPGMHVLIAKWAPPQERSKIASGVYAGMTLGTLVCMPFSGFLAAVVDWSAVFYVQGGLSLLWYALWLIFVYDSPAQHPRISRAEKKYIEESLGTVVKTEKPPVPWKSVWTSLPVWAIIVAHTCSNWGWYMLLVKLPTYMRYILKFDIKSNAALSAVPFLCMWIFTMVLANILDALRSRSIITTTFARKLATFCASIPPAICLIGVTYVGCNTDLAVALLTLGTMFVGGMYSGFLSNHIDIAPPFAGTLMGITNTFATFPGIIVPSFVGYMTHGNQTVEAWRTIFFITLGIFGFEAVFYLIFGSGEQQEWAKPKPQPQEGEQQKLNDIP